MLRPLTFKGAGLAVVMVIMAAVFSFPFQGQAAERPKLSQHQTRRVAGDLQMDIGYRRDNLDWNIAGNSSGSSPNILSELEWSDLEIIQVKLRGRAVINGRFYLRGIFDYGWIYDGQNRDSDYLGDNRTGEFSRTINTTEDDQVWDGSVGFGWLFSFGTDFFRLAPMAGYSIHKQDLRITDGNQVIPATGSFEGLDSTYKARWNGPWIGFDLTFSTPDKRRLGRDMRFLLTMEYHWADYYGEADWNLRADFEHPKSFEHEADGTGMVLGCKWLAGFRSDWDFSLGGQYQVWKTDSGVDRVFFANGLRSETRLNEVNWESFEIMVGINYRF